MRVSSTQAEFTAYHVRRSGWPGIRTSTTKQDFRSTYSRTMWFADRSER